MKRNTRGCLFAALAIIVLLVLTCGILAETSTPLSTWLFQHNYYFEALVNFLHGKR